MKIRRELRVIGAALLALSGSYARGAEAAKPSAPTAAAAERRRAKVRCRT